MKMKKKSDSLSKDAMQLGGASINLSLMSGIVQKSGGNAEPMTTFGSFMPALGSATGAKNVINSVKKIKK